MKESGYHKYPSQTVVDILRLIGYSISIAAWFIRYQGRQNIPPNDSPPFLIVSNHQTYVDPVWICLPLRRRVRYMAFGDAFGWPIVGKLIRYLGAFPVSMNKTGILTAIKESIRTLRDGAVLVVFPEGAREFADGEFLEFKSGAIKIAAQAKVPILPVTISGGNRIWPQQQKYPRLFRRVTITYHPLVDFVREGASLSDYEIELWTEKIRSIIEARTKAISS